MSVLTRWESTKWGVDDVRMTQTDNCNPPEMGGGREEGGSQPQDIWRLTFLILGIQIKLILVQQLFQDTEMAVVSLRGGETGFTTEHCLEY